MQASTKNNSINANSIILIITAISFIYFLMYEGFIFQSSLSIALFIGFFFHLLNRIGKDIPIKELMTLMLSLQLLISPLFTYHYFHNKMEFPMLIGEEYYITFVLSYIILFSFGLFIPIIKTSTTFNSIDIPINYQNGKIGLALIIFGFVSFYLGKFMPASFRFVFYLFSYARLIGALIVLFSNLKSRYLLFGFTFLHFAYIIISGAIFYDLIIWAFFFYMALEIQLKSSFYRKIGFALLGLLSLVFLQSIKSDYRQKVWNEDKKEDSSNIETFLSVANDANESKSVTEESSFKHLITRLNTGWIVSAVLVQVPSRQKFAEGKLLLDDLKNVLLPRFLAPNKKSVGGDENRDKFLKYTGRRLNDDTTMRIGVLADAYINFGYLGGALLMFLFGILINVSIAFFKYKYFNSIYYLWILFIFSFTVRMSDFIVIINSTFKSFLAFILIIYIIKKILPPINSEKIIHNEIC